MATDIYFQNGRKCNSDQDPIVFVQALLFTVRYTVHRLCIVHKIRRQNWLYSKVVYNFG